LAATATGPVAKTLQDMMDVPSAYWLDNKKKITGSGTDTMEGILADAASKATPELVVFIVYDLPNRDCHAKASNGEICCSYKADGRCDYLDSGDGTCSAGLKEYQEEYIDQIAAVLKKNAGKVPVVLVIEPDSLPNLSTNKADPRCGNSNTETAYTKGVSYAVETLAAADPSVAMYLDAGHGGWLGWKDNMADFVTTIKGLGIAKLIRGFATNVANYQSLGEMCPVYNYCLNNAHPEASCCQDPCGLTKEWNPSNNENNYALHLRTAMSEGIPGFTPHMIIDTGRNGVADMRTKCANWCNIRGAGIEMILILCACPLAADV
jgi:cellulose 1,4-beta-cellobiosidase